MENRPGLFLAGFLLFQSLAAYAGEGSGHPQLAEPLFNDRFQSFKSAGYDPLTVPVTWYRPLEQVPGKYRSPHYPEPVPPATQTISKQALKTASVIAGEQNSTALLVWHRGELQHEEYWQGHSRDRFFNPQSMSKTVLGLMLGIAIRDGHIKSVDDPVADYIQEWKNDARGKISIKNLLQMSGGLAQISNSYEITLKNPAVFQHFGTDFAGPVLALPLMEKPGTRWEYNNNEANLLGIILERASGRRYAEYLSKALWQPAGLADSSLYMDRPGGMPMFSCCILSRPMDWLKLGILVMQRGNLEGNQVVPENWIQDMITPSGPNKGYGYQIWLGDHAVAPERPEPHYPNQHWSSEPYADPETIVFRGFGYQRVWIMPSRNLIIVRAGRAWPAKWDNTAIPNVVYHGSR